jgi:bifunctional DNA-binding transcriptional regulator/antitoxin component of YhaV-PrlF toxin-antitoxin module
MLQASGSYPLAALEAFDAGEPKFRYHQRMPKQRASRPAVSPDAGIGNSEVFRAVLEADGKIALPAAMRKHLGVAAGDLLVLDPRPDGTAVVVGLKQVVRQARGLLRGTAPAVSVVDELIAERREEARREDEESER